VQVFDPDFEEYVTFDDPAQLGLKARIRLCEAEVTEASTC
jgi:hypothetical protein